MGGLCMNKMRGHADEVVSLDQRLEKHSIKRRASITQSQQFYEELPTNTQMEYWKRRHTKICGNNNDYISQRNMRDLFSYMCANNETIKMLHQLFKDKKEILDNQSFFQSLRKFGASNYYQLSALIYTLYFRNPQLFKSSAVLQRFQSQLKTFIKPGRPQQNGLRSSQNLQNSYDLQKNVQVKLKDLGVLLNQRKSTQDSKQVQKWLKRNMDLKRFRYFILEGGLKQNQKEAYKELYKQYYSNNDFKLGASSMGQKNKQAQVCIISWRWCERFNRYITEKYEVKGKQGLKRRPTIDNQAVLLTNNNKVLNKRQSLLKSNIMGQSNPRMSGLLRGSQNEDLNFSANILILQKQNLSSTQYKSYPGEVDNKVLIGNFPWELKRNIRKDADYVTVSQAIYENLVLCFGGGPKLQRRTIQGYLELRPYFILAYMYNIDQQKYGNLSQEQLIKVSSSDPISSLFLDKINIYVCYHRNIGGDWQRFPPQDPLQKNSKIIDVFSQTSFLIYMTSNNQKLFKTTYMNRTDKPTIGQMYSSKSYKVGQNAQTINKQQNIQVCVVGDQMPGYVRFVLLNWTSHLQRNIPINQFANHFKLNNNNLVNTVVLKKKRAGISNMGNTCYMNSILQAFLNSCKDENLEGLKGQLGVQLREINRKIKQIKKSVFPVDFKTIFDKNFPFFKGQDQHDAHQFCLCLFEQFEKGNKKLIQELLQIKIKQIYKCTHCQKVKQLIAPSFMVELPLRDFQKKQVKIDYITENKIIQTVVFEIQEQCKVQDWKRNFQKASGAKNYYLCEIQNSSISRTFNKEDNLDSQPFHELGIQNQFLITAYETKTINTKYKLAKHKQHEFRTYRDSKNNYYIAKVCNVPIQPSSRSLPSGNINSQTILDGNGSSIVAKGLIKIKIPFNDIGEKQVREQELLSFPQDYPNREVYIKIINYDQKYNEKIGKPFIFKMPSTLPLSAVRLELQRYFGTNGYFLRVAPIGQFERCRICQRKFQTNGGCFMSLQSFLPICWVQGRVEFVAVWMNASQYDQCTRRIKYTPNSSKVSPKTQQFDSFEMSLRKSQQIQVLQIQKCEECGQRNAKVQNQQKIYRWPQILVCHLKRFAIKHGQVTKIHTKWKYQQILYINKSKYVLSAVVCHIGISADYGHYITIAGGTKYDDELVTSMSYDQIKPEDISMLFYVRQDL